MNEINYELIGNRIKSLREEKGLTQSELAEMTNFSVPYISFLETGKKHASLSSITKIALSLDVTVDALLYDAQTDIEASYTKELQTLFSDCNVKERRFLIDFLALAKALLRKHK